MGPPEPPLLCGYAAPTFLTDEQDSKGGSGFQLLNRNSGTLTIGTHKQRITFRTPSFLLQPTVGLSVGLIRNANHKALGKSASIGIDPDLPLTINKPRCACMWVDP